jgi:hypothetical protein
MGEECIYNTDGKPGGKRSLRRTRLRYVNNIKGNLLEIIR